MGSQDIYSRVLNKVDTKPQKSRRLKVFFLAQKNEISEALDKGLSIVSIWEVLHDEGNFKGSYKTFCKYVKTLIRKERTTLSTPTLSGNSAGIQKDVPKTEKKNKFDWSPNYNPDDLL